MILTGQLLSYLYYHNLKKELVTSILYPKKINQITNDVPCNYLYNSEQINICMMWDTTYTHLINPMFNLFGYLNLLR